jgi:hypothetical protein
MLGFRVLLGKINKKIKLSQNSNGASIPLKKTCVSG